MKTGAKIIVNLIRGIIIAIVLCAAALWLFKGVLLKYGIETGGTKALNVGVSAGDVELSVLRGDARIRDLAIQNPAGYAIDKLLTVGEIEIQLDVPSLMSDTVNIEKLRLDNINLAIEQKGLSNNLGDVIAGVRRNTSEKTQPATGRKLAIKELQLDNIKVTVKLLPLPGKADKVELRLAPIVMRNLGEGNNVTMAQMSEKVLAAIAGSVADKGIGILPKDFVAAIKNASEGNVVTIVTETGKEVVEKSTEAGKKVLESGKDLGKGVTDAFKGLLTPKKQE